MIDRPSRIDEMCDQMGKDLLDFFEQVSDSWETWIDYKFAQHREQYASARTETIAVKNLRELALGRADLAIRLVENAIGNLWKGIYRPQLSVWKDWTAPVSPAPAPQDTGRIIPFLANRPTWPEKIFRDPEGIEYFQKYAPEVTGDYEDYLAEVRQMGFTFKPLTKPQFVAWCRQWGNACLDTTMAPYELAQFRMQAQIDCNTSDFAHFFIHKIHQAK